MLISGVSSVLFLLLTSELNSVLGVLNHEAKATVTPGHPHPLDSILPEDYNRDLVPTQDGQGPVNVTVSVNLLNVHLSSDASQAFTVDMFLHMWWEDHRLKWPSVAKVDPRTGQLAPNDPYYTYKLNDGWRDKLWVPDTYFRNVIDGKLSNVLTPTGYFQVSNRTQIFWAVRIALKLSCAMDFGHFPFDTQRCFINITSTYESTEELVLSWDVFRVGNHVDGTEFEILTISKASCVKEYDDLDPLACLYGEIEFRRNIGNYLIKRFVPSALIVILTFMGFWVPTTIAPARISLSITALLALITQQIQSDLNVSYVYALQIWNSVCIGFVFASLFEFVLALYVMHMWDKARKHAAERAAAAAKQAEISASNGNSNGKLNGLISRQSSKQPQPSTPTSPPPPKLFRQPSRTVQEISKWRARLYKHFRTSTRHSWVDNLSRYLFPIGFIGFILTFLRQVNKI